MSNWFRRWRQRQRDLARGVDADLVRQNRNRFKLAFGLWGVGFLLSLLRNKASISGVLGSIAQYASVALIFAGIFLGFWAGQVNAFLDKPDPEEPPRLFKR
jgi:hypothetical protein